LEKKNSYPKPKTPPSKTDEEWFFLRGKERGGLPKEPARKKVGEKARTG